MDELFTEAIKQVPALGVLVFIVIKFLAFIRETEVARSSSLEALGDTCHAFQERLGAATQKVIDRNSEALEKNTEAMIRIEVILDDIDKAVASKNSRGHA